MDDIFHLIKAYNVVEVQFHLLLTSALEGDVSLRSLPHLDLEIVAIPNE